MRPLALLLLLTACGDTPAIVINESLSMEDALFEKEQLCFSSEAHKENMCIDCDRLGLVLYECAAHADYVILHPKDCNAW